MTEADLLEVAREALWVMLKVSGPTLIVGLIVGVLISLVQTATQIQEMTLTFVPKFVLVFLSLILFMPFMLNVLSDFTKLMLDRAIAGG